MMNLARNGYLDNFHELIDINSNTLADLIVKTEFKVKDKKNIKII